MNFSTHALFLPLLNAKKAKRELVNILMQSRVETALLTIT